jgi:hypothetical protein
MAYLEVWLIIATHPIMSMFGLYDLETGQVSVSWTCDHCLKVVSEGINGSSVSWSKKLDMGHCRTE